MKRKFEKDGFTFVIEHIHDGDREYETPEEQQLNYRGCTKAQKSDYFKRDEARYNAWRNREWNYIGISCKVLKNTSSNWANGGLEVGRASVWGIESDSDDSLIKEMEEEMIAEALLEVERLKKALCS